jgi:4-oxalocrotonate tautomerase
MPLLYVDLIEGRAPAEVRALLDAIHDAVVEAFGVPPRDRYQVVRMHPIHEIVVWDTGLGIDRSSQLVVLHVVSRRRSPEMKQRFYQLVAANLAARCGLDSADLVVSITDNDDEDCLRRRSFSAPMACWWAPGFGPPPRRWRLRAHTTGLSEPAVTTPTARGSMTLCGGWIGHPNTTSGR